jgi:hypothetical protein
LNAGASAQLYGSIGRDTEAEPLCQRALAIMEKAVRLDAFENRARD